MHKTGWYIDLRIVFTHSFEHEIPNLVFNLVSSEKKFGAVVSWVLKKCLSGDDEERAGVGTEPHKAAMDEHAS